MKSPEIKYGRLELEIDLRDTSAVFQELLRLTSARKIREAEKLTAMWFAAHPEQKN